MRMFAIMIVFVGACTSEPQYGTPEYVKLEAQKEIAYKLKDPSSAQFSEVRISSNGAVCGEVNGKNAYGAYSGASAFVYIPFDSKHTNIQKMEFGAFLEGGEGANYPSPQGLKNTDFNALYSQHCFGIGRDRQEKDKKDF